MLSRLVQLAVDRALLFFSPYGIWYASVMNKDDPSQYMVERWASDGSHIEEVIARCSRVTVARAAFDAAVSEYPGCIITLSQGMQLIDRTTIPDPDHKHRA